MPKVQRLPDAVINQVAAGEVVERPASVVKELLENALDAEASRLAIDLEGGGLTRIRVIDDGLGLSAEDARLALERHATSKLRAVEDLESLTTLGFRGEALPSIASVSRFTLVSAPRGSLGGTELVVEGGTLVREGPVGAPPGTTIVVEDLFYNVPARRKFLKRPETELTHVHEMVVRLALAHPRVAFRLTHDGRQLLDAPAEAPQDPRGRLGRLLGRDVAGQLHAIPPSERSLPVEVRGFIGAPSLSERGPRGLHTFVNGRYVRDRTIQSAVQEAYRSLLERGRYPVVVLHLGVDPKLVDVNVHPQKIEVRFSSTSDVFRAVLNAVTRALREEPWMQGRVAPSGASEILAAARAGGQGGLFAGGEQNLGDEAGDSRLRGPADAEGRSLGDEDRPPSGLGPRGLSPGWGEVAREGAPTYTQRDMSPRPDPWRGPRGFGAEIGALARERAREGALDDATLDLLRAAPPLAAHAPAVRFQTLQPIGQILRTYVVCEGVDRLILIDQHAAHERVAYERLRRQHLDSAIAVQPLLIPEVLELDLARQNTAETAGEALHALGFELEPFGGQSWVLKAAPAALGVVDARALVLDLLDELREQGRTDVPVAERAERLLSCAACHTAVRAGDKLQQEEIRALLKAMDEIDFGAHCPHGRPVFVEWSARHLASLFHRT